MCQMRRADAVAQPWACSFGNERAEVRQPMSGECEQRTASPPRWTKVRLLHLLLAAGLALLIVLELTLGSRRPDWHHVLGMGGAGFFLALEIALQPRRRIWTLALLAASAACFVLGYFVFPR